MRKPSQPQRRYIEPEYTGKVPSYALLHNGIIFGWALIFTGLAIFGLICAAALSLKNGNCSASGTGTFFCRFIPVSMPWMWLSIFGALVAAGAILALSCYYRYVTFYTEVLQGRVVDHEWRSSLFGDKYYLVIRGYNLAGVIHEAKMSVQPKEYFDYGVGEFVDLN